ncbi:MAG: hypothetical protein LBR26_08220 [Prevotella sp.]|jgi:hypothetical protein|nr:hypothetical protein [Prevotella sp.]
MKLTETLGSGDILYRVDPKKLSVKTYRISHADEKEQTPTTYENFVMEKKERKPVWIPGKKFPFEFRGSLYFLTEDDANHYIKTQIGM